MIRCFLAFPLGETTADELFAQRGNLRCSIHGLRWIQGHQFHITLIFLGEQTRQNVDDIAAIVSETFRGCTPFEISMTGPGQFPPKGQPRVIYEAIDQGREECTRIQRKLAILLSKVICLDKRKYHPHITLARIPYHHPFEFMKETFGPLKPVKGIIDRAVLYESLIHRDGTEYIPITEWIFKNREAAG